jgi:Protein of unknown function (DUF2806)
MTVESKQQGSGLPAALIGVAKALLGPVFAYPAAWLNRPTRAIEDVTAGRSLVAEELAKAAADQLKQDPAVMAAAIDLYAPNAIRKLQNTAAVVSQAAIEFNDDAIEHGTDPDVDWLNGFHRHAEDASSKRMRNIFGKILAGEIRTPGSFSLTSIRLVAELSPTIAQDFANVYNRCATNWFLKDKNVRGPEWEVLVRLEDAGLVSLRDCVIHQPKVLDWSFSGSESIYILAKMKCQSGITIPIFSLTNAGLELGKLLPDPDVEPVLREVAKRIAPAADSIKLIKNNWAEDILATSLP